MFAPIVLPVQLTFLVMAILAMVLSVALRRYTKNYLFATFAICFFATIPMLFCVGFIVDSLRYGEFHYATATGLNDGYVELPKSATEITLHKYASGHELKFKTTKTSLESWMNELTNKRREFSKATPFQQVPRSDFRSEEFDPRLSRHGWICPDDAVLYEGWRSGRGSGFDVWFSEKQQTAYISAAYW